MKHIVKSRFNKKQKTALILIPVLIFTVVMSVILGIIFLGEEPAEKPVPPEIIEGEDLVNNLAVAYPVVEEEDIMYISVKFKNGVYKLLRPDTGETFRLFYTTDDGKEVLYQPKIEEENSAFDYSSIYAIEKDDGYGRITKLDYLLISLQYAYFSERIPLSTDPTERAKQLSEYGLSEEEVQVISFAYKDEDGNDKKQTVKIGSKVITGASYYFMIEGRDYVYMSSNTYYEYGLMGFKSLIKASLVSEGLTEDNGFGPYLTPNYFQWLSTMHKEEGLTVPEDSKVIVFSDVLIPVEKDEGYENPTTDGYIRDGYQYIEFDLSELKDKEEYMRLMNALRGKTVGTYYDVETGAGDPKNQIIFSLTTRTKAIDFSEKESVKYEYTIVSVDAILTDSGEISDTGTPVGDNNLIKVAYNYSIDGVVQNTVLCHGVIDLGDSGIPEDKLSELKAASVGPLNSHITYTVDYTKDNAVANTIRYVVTEIISIFDQKGEVMTNVTADSIVSYRYYVEIDGEKSGDEETAVLNFKEANSEDDQGIKNALMDKEVSTGLHLEVYSYTGYYQHIYDFMTYKIAKIEGFVTSKLIAAFRFQNNSERDPYYGESLYENLMKDEYSLYGLNSTSCETVVKILGGVSNDSTSNTAQGLAGAEVLEIGITPEIMMKYGLYAHTIYFELPQGINATEIEGEESFDELDDYYYYDKIKITLYISEVQPDGTRYVASDMYDIVTKIDADTFSFLDYSFEEFWARRNIILMDVNDIEEFNIEFMMDDLVGKFDMALKHQTLYIQGNNAYLKPPEGQYSKFNHITVSVTPSGVCTPTKLQELMTQKGYEFMSLTELYDTLYPNDPEASKAAPDSLGTSYFKDAMRMIYVTNYDGTLTDEEQEDFLNNGKLMMRMTLKIKSNAYRYVYEFYRGDDRRVMVRLYKADMDGNMKTQPISDFYVSTFTLKKFATNFKDLFDGKKITPDVGYPDEL